MEGVRVFSRRQKKRGAVLCIDQSHLSPGRRLADLTVPATDYLYLLPHLTTTFRANCTTYSTVRALGAVPMCPLQNFLHLNSNNAIYHHSKI